MGALSHRSPLRFSLCDRLLVEKIFAQYMVPHSLETEEKMKCLYYLYACLDTNAVRSETYSLCCLDFCEPVLMFFSICVRGLPSHI